MGIKQRVQSIASTGVRETARWAARLHGFLARHQFDHRMAHQVAQVVSSVCQVRQRQVDRAVVLATHRCISSLFGHRIPMVCTIGDYLSCSLSR